MRIEIVGKSNKPYIMINTLTLVDEADTEIIIDRNTTWYNQEDLNNGYLDAEWTGCYVWDGVSEHILHNTDIEWLKKCRVKSLDLEDDAEADYKIDLCEVFLYADAFPVVNLVC